MDFEWFDALILDCKAISTEYGFTHRWSQVEGRHALGLRIVEENDNFKRQSVYGLEVVKKVAKALGISARTVQYAVQFAQKCPDLTMLPYGKDCTWTKIVKEYLPENPIPQKNKEKYCPFCNHLLP
jgi:hypothetical protein